MTTTQSTAQATVNPYWDAVQNAINAGGSLPFESAGKPDLRARDDLVSRYSWAICSPQDIAWMVDILDGRGVVEIGAGRGYWAWMLDEAGVDVVAYDKNPPNLGENDFYRAADPGALTTYFPVQTGDADAVAPHLDRALFTCWPPYGSDIAYRATRAWAGDLLIYCGEGWGGCCADDDFFELLDREWEQVGECDGHVQWSCINDRLTAYRRKS